MEGRETGVDVVGEPVAVVDVEMTADGVVEEPVVAPKKKGRGGDRIQRGCAKKMKAAQSAASKKRRRAAARAEKILAQGGAAADAIRIQAEANAEASAIIANAFDPTVKLPVKKRKTNAELCHNYRERSKATHLREANAAAGFLRDLKRNFLTEDE